MSLRPDSYRDCGARGINLYREAKQRKNYSKLFPNTNRACRSSEIVDSGIPIIK